MSFRARASAVSGTGCRAAVSFHVIRCLTLCVMERHLQSSKSRPPCRCGVALHCHMHCLGNMFQRCAATCCSCNTANFSAVLSVGRCTAIFSAVLSVGHHRRVSTSVLHGKALVLGAVGLCRCSAISMRSLVLRNPYATALTAKGVAVLTAWRIRRLSTCLRYSPLCRRIINCRNG